MYEALLHSSIIINPMFFRGANIALLAPTTSFTSHFNIFLYSSYFSPSLSLECSIATSFENSLLSLDIICGVRLISGTRKIAVCPLFKQSFINFIYISVLPLPVTPCKSIVLFLLFFISLYASFCSCDNSIFFGVSLFIKIFLFTSFFVSHTIPFLISVFRLELFISLFKSSLFSFNLLIIFNCDSLIFLFFMYSSVFSLLANLIYFSYFLFMFALWSAFNALGNIAW